MMKICAFIWLTLKYILVILVDVKSNSFHIYNLLTFPPEVPFRGIFFCLRLSQKQVFDLGDRGINEWVPAAEPGNPSFSSAEVLALHSSSPLGWFVYKLPCRLRS